MGDKEKIMVPVHEADMPHLLWALDLAQQNTRFWREAKASTEAEQLVGKWRGTAIARLQSTVLESGNWK